MLILIILHHFLALLLKENFVFVPVFRHHMIKLINWEVRDLLLRNTSKRSSDALGKLNRRIVYSDRHWILRIFRLARSDFLVILNVTSSVIDICEARVYAHVLRLIHRLNRILYRNFIAEILVAFEDRGVGRNKLWVLLLHDISSLFLLMPTTLIDIH